MERDPADKKSKKKSSKEAKHKRRKEEKKAKEKHKRRRSRSRSSSSSSSSGGDARAETPAQELARLREACTQLRSLLRSFPDVPRRDVRLLLWNVDAGQGVDLTPLPGASRCASCGRFRSARRLTWCAARRPPADEQLRAALTRLFETLRLKRTPSGLHVSLPGAPPVLRAVGHVFDEPLDAQPAQPVPAPDPLRRHAAPIGACAAASPAARAAPSSPDAPARPRKAAATRACIHWACARRRGRPRLGQRRASAATRCRAAQPAAVAEPRHRASCAPARRTPCGRATARAGAQRACARGAGRGGVAV